MCSVHCFAISIGAFYYFDNVFIVCNDEFIIFEKRLEKYDQVKIIIITQLPKFGRIEIRIAKIANSTESPFKTVDVL